MLSPSPNGLVYIVSFFMGLIYGGHFFKSLSMKVLVKLIFNVREKIDFEFDGYNLGGDWFRSMKMSEWYWDEKHCLVMRNEY